MQGDVIALYRSDYNSTSKSYSPTLIATYTYDPWGAPTGIYDANGSTISQTAYHVAAYNPFWYRCYRYDGDTRLYYLQSRYYDPAIGRFINADVYDITYWDEGDGILRYDYVYTKSKELEYAEAALTVIAIGVITYATCGAGATVAGPALGGALGALVG